MDATHFSEAERATLNKAIAYVTDAIGNALELLHEAERDAERQGRDAERHAHLNAVLKSAAKNGIAAPDHDDESARLRQEIARSREGRLVSLIGMAASAVAVANLLSPAASDRQRAEVKKSQMRLKQAEAAHARAGKDAASKRVDVLVLHHANRELKEKKHAKKKRKPTPYRLADEIQGAVNADADKDDLKKLGAKGDEPALDASAIAKRIRKLKILDR
jgi:hypothetical protein